MSRGVVKCSGRIETECITLGQFNEDLCLQQLDSEVHLMHQRLSGLYGLTWSGRVGSCWNCQWLANEVTRWIWSV